MSLIRSKDTKPEIIARRILSALGVRYRLHRKDLPGTPDIYIARIKTAVFVNGCFWHRHPCKLGGRVPRSRRGYWIPKLRTNAGRDKRTARALKALGIKQVVLWTCEQRNFPGRCASVARRYHLAQRGDV